MGRLGNFLFLDFAGLHALRADFVCVVGMAGLQALGAENTTRGPDTSGTGLNTHRQSWAAYGDRKPVFNLHTPCLREALQRDIEHSQRGAIFKRLHPSLE